jgi:hypothetical protein
VTDVWLGVCSTPRRICVSADRGRGWARQRYLRASKAELVERLLIAENAHAAMESLASDC